MIIHAYYPSCASAITLQSRGKLRPKFDLFHICYRGNGELTKLRWVNFQKSMGHEGSNERASVNVRRGGCAFLLSNMIETKSFSTR